MRHTGLYTFHLAANADQGRAPGQTSPACCHPGQAFLSCPSFLVCGPPNLAEGVEGWFLLLIHCLPSALTWKFTGMNP